MGAFDRTDTLKTHGRRDPKNLGGERKPGGGGRRRKLQPPVGVLSLKRAADYLDLLARVECASTCSRPNPEQDHIDRHRNKIIRKLAADAAKEKP